METFKTIHEYPDYLVSDLGNILSVKGDRLLKPYKCSNGYLQVKLTNNGCTKGELVHRLVAKAFIPNPNNLAQINHKDEDRTNNRVENLEWCDQSYNMNYGTGNLKRKEKLEYRESPWNSKKVLQFTLENVLVREWNSTMEIERVLGYKNTNIGSCCRGKATQAYGYIWRYKSI